MTNPFPHDLYVRKKHEKPNRPLCLACLANVVPRPIYFPSWRTVKNDAGIDCSMFLKPLFEFSKFGYVSKQQFNAVRILAVFDKLLPQHISWARRRIHDFVVSALFRVLSRIEKISYKATAMTNTGISATAHAQARAQACTSARISTTTNTAEKRLRMRQPYL